MTTGLIYPLITSGLFILTSIAELVLVFVLSARVQTLQPSTATGIFFAYAVLNGLNLSSIFLVYDFGSLILAFLVGAVYFGVMAVYGNVTSRPANIQPKVLDINSESVPKGLSAYEISE